MHDHSLRGIDERAGDALKSLPACRQGHETGRCGEIGRL
jgi:hypothetical protein